MQEYRSSLENIDKEYKIQRPPATLLTIHFARERGCMGGTQIIRQDSTETLVLYLYTVLSLRGGVSPCNSYKNLAYNPTAVEKTKIKDDYEPLFCSVLSLRENKPLRLMSLQGSNFLFAFFYFYKSLFAVMIGYPI